LITKLILNNAVVTPIEVTLKKEGDRAIDQIRVSIPPNKTVSSNQSLIWLQDYVTLDNLSAIYNLQSSVKDESGNDNHGTATNITYGSDGKWADRYAIFNGTDSKIEVPDSNSLDFSGKFDVVVWLKWTATTTSMPVLSKRTTATDGWQLEVNTSSAGDVSFKIGTTTITSSSAGYNDGAYHMVRVTRNENNLITLYVDNVSKGSATNNTNATSTAILKIGNGSLLGTGVNLFQPTSGLFQSNIFDTGLYYPSQAVKYFAGSISRIRLYNSQINDPEATKLYSKPNPRLTIKFGGYVTKIDDKTHKKDIIAQSYGKVLGETEIRGETYDNKSPEYIVNDLITNNTNFTYVQRGDASNLILTKYTADGKLIDIIRNFASLTNKMFYTTGNFEFVFEPIEFTITEVSLVNGTDCRILESGHDDTLLVNDLTVLGENLRYQTEETQNLSSATTMTLAFGATSIKIEHGGSELLPEVDYSLDSSGKSVTFSTAKSGSTKATYEYEKPLYFRGKRESSITTHGVHAKRLNLPWISNREDGIRFVQSYLNRYKDVDQKIKVEFGEHENFLNENDLVFVTSQVLDITDQSYVIKSIEWKYPQMSTTLNIGEYYFDYFEYDKQIVEKLHNVESALTTIKDIRDYESPEEILPLVDSMGVTVQDVQQYTETLNMSDSDHIYDKSRATWGSSKYGSRRPGVSSQDVYGSGA
jgi:hypothetical protein